MHTAIRYAQNFLTDHGCSNAIQEGRWIVEAVAKEFSPASPEFMQKTEKLLQRRIQGEPLQYVLGSTDFFCLELEVGPGVLIPRPETEILVEEALALYSGTGLICDLCTGSGAIPLALAKMLPNAEFFGCDISSDALYWAEKNKATHALGNVHFFQGDLFAAFPPQSRFSLLTANPPYVTQWEFDHIVPSNVKDYEPENALVSGADGLDLLRRIIQGAPAFLSQNAWMLMEIGCAQGEAVTELLRAANWRNVRIRKDYENHDRIAIGQRPLQP